MMGKIQEAFTNSTIFLDQEKVLDYLDNAEGN